MGGETLVADTATIGSDRFVGEGGTGTCRLTEYIKLEQVREMVGTHAFEIGQYLCPKERPELNDARNELIVLHTRELGVECDHARRDEFKGIMLECGDRLARGHGDDG